MSGRPVFRICRTKIVLYTCIAIKKLPRALQSVLCLTEVGYCHFLLLYLTFLFCDTDNWTRAVTKRCGTRCGVINCNQLLLTRAAVFRGELHCCTPQLGLINQPQPPPAVMRCNQDTWHVLLTPGAIVYQYTPLAVISVTRTCDTCCRLAQVLLCALDLKCSLNPPAFGQAITNCWFCTI